MPIHDAEHEPTPTPPNGETEQNPALNLPADAAEAIRLLYPRYGDAVYRTIYRIALDEAEAQDLTQETFVRAYRAWDRFDRTNARSWLLRIATNLAITHYRNQRRRRRVAPWMLLPNGGVDEPGEQSEDKDLVAWLMRPLTAEQRALIALHYYQQIPRVEIAAQLGIPAGTVASRINKAMQVLRRRAQAIGVMQAPERADDRLRVLLPPVDAVLAAASAAGGRGALAGEPAAAGSGAHARTGAAGGPTAFLWQQWVAVMALVAIVMVPAILLSQTSGSPPSDSEAAVAAPAPSTDPSRAPRGSSPTPVTHPTPLPTSPPSPAPGPSTPVPSTLPAQGPGSTPGSTPAGGPSAPSPTPSQVPSPTPTPTPVHGPTPTPTPVQGPTPTPTPVVSPTPGPGQTPAATPTR